MNFRHFLGLYNGDRIDPVIVANVDPVIAAALEAKVLRVFLSRETILKQQVKHSELTADDYRVLPPAMRLGEFRLEKPRSAIVLFVDSRLHGWGFRAHVKATANGREMYVDSFCLMRKKTYGQALAKVQPIIRPHGRI
jgi:hypothetical protein